MGVFAMTGGATGIGAELKGQLQTAGHQVISVDIKEGDVIADLSTVEGREAAIAGDPRRRRLNAITGRCAFHTRGAVLGQRHHALGR